MLSKVANNVFFKSVIICDDVRQEKNNKFILIGVYSGDIVVSQFPATLALQVYAEHVSSKAGTFSFQTRYFFNEEQKAVWKGTLHIEKSETAYVMIMPPTLLEAIPEGELRIEIALDEEPPITLTRKRVQMGELTTIPNTF